MLRVPVARTESKVQCSPEERSRLDKHSAISRLGNHHARARAVAKQYGGAAIVPIDHRRERVRSDYKYAFEIAGAHLCVRDLNRIHETGARCGDVEGGNRRDAETLLNLAREGREAVLGGNSADDDRVEIGGLDAGALERGAAGVGRDFRERLTLAHQVALADSGARPDPFVGRVHVPFEIAVGQSGARDGPSGGDNS